MIPQPPPGQGPVDPRGAFSPPPPPSGGGPGWTPPPGPPPPPPGNGGGRPPGGMPMMPMMPVMMPPPYYPPPKQGARLRRRDLHDPSDDDPGPVDSAQHLPAVLYRLPQRAAAGHEEVIVDGEMSQEIAAIPIDGEIDDNTAQQVDRTLHKLDKDTNVKALFWK